MLRASKGAVIRIIWDIVLRRQIMIALYFGNSCFKCPASEQTIHVVIAPKCEHATMDDFITKAFDYLESDDAFSADWPDLYKNRTYTPATEEQKNFIKSCLSELNNINISYETIINVVNIVPAQWNDISFGIETGTEYIFLNWGTSA